MRAFSHLIVGLSLLLPVGAAAKGDLASHTQAIEPLVLGSEASDYAIAPKEIRIETGKSYRWKIKSSGKKEYKFVATELWRNSWIRQVKVEDTTVKTSAVDEIDFDEEGEVEVFFVPIRPGLFEFHIRGLEEKGMVGKIVVE